MVVNRSAEQKSQGSAVLSGTPSVAERLLDLYSTERRHEPISDSAVVVPLVQLPPIYRIAKRAVDIVVSGTLLLLLLPLFALIVVAVKVTSKGPVLYRATRIGAGGRPLRFIKFRTMYVDADERKRALAAQNEREGPIFKIRNDPRITSVGRWLRKFSLDELPQLIHVFTGEMSLVGPRPHLPGEVAGYDEPTYERLSVKPGLTCYWQVQGRSDLSYEKWIELDLSYVRQMNMWTDLKILAKTPIAVVLGRGAY